MYLRLSLLFILFLRIPVVLSQDYTVAKIWDAAPHNAFTDLTRYAGKYYCIFREGPGHNPTPGNPADGKVRILVSADGENWESAALLEKEGVDLRDSKFSVTPDGRLMILMGGSFYPNGTLTGRQPHVVFMDPQGKFTGIMPANIDESIRSYMDWLWRVSWDPKTGTGYGVVYQDFPDKESGLYLVKTVDGKNYTHVSRLNLTGKPNESTVEMLEDGKMRMIVRREGSDKKGMAGLIGYSEAPYVEWQWYDLGIRLGGPNIITLPNGKTLIGSRFHVDPTKNFPARMSLFGLDKNNKAVKWLDLPSGDEGDTSYPGFLVVGDELWVSYHSTDKAKTGIYLAKIKLAFFNTSVDNELISVSNIESQMYTGSAICPEPVITDTENGKILVQETDYTLSYANNTEIGYARIIIGGIGNYKGSRTVTFRIISDVRPSVEKIEVNHETVASLSRPFVDMGCGTAAATIKVVVPSQDIRVNFHVSDKVYSGGYSVTIPLEQPQIYRVGITAYSDISERTYDLQIERRFEFDHLVAIRNHTLSVLPSFGNIGFKSWQLYRKPAGQQDFTPLLVEAGAAYVPVTMSYTPSGNEIPANPEDVYYAAVVTMDNDTIRSCEKKWDIIAFVDQKTAGNADFRIYPNPVIRGMEFFFEGPYEQAGKTEILMLHLSGYPVLQMHVTEPSVRVKAPDTPGIYPLIVRTGNKKCKNWKVIVQ
ncbi:MAG: hypothetical protein LBQ60_15835 [Bacteroidales bacterium]|jgi:hypothetical protein|nr:hypothetical protein [Bacteroidales bacterium]